MLVSPRGDWDETHRGRRRGVDALGRALLKECTLVLAALGRCLCVNFAQEEFGCDGCIGRAYSDCFISNADKRARLAGDCFPGRGGAALALAGRAGLAAAAGALARG